MGPGVFPIAVVALLLVGLGFNPVVAVAAPAIGHSWSVTFGPLGASFQALMAVTGLDDVFLAPWSALLLTYSAMASYLVFSIKGIAGRNRCVGSSPKQSKKDNRDRFMMTPKGGKNGTRAAAAGLRPVTHTKLHEQIVAQIQDLIQSGNLQYGDRLPPERELSDIFGVSRHSVREAVRRLEQQGVLKSRAGSGTFVVLEDARSLSEFLAVAVRQEKSKISEVFEFRRMIEPQIARLAAMNAAPSDIRHLERIFRDQMQSLDDPVLAGTHDQAFHVALARATGNSVLFHIVERIGDVLRFIRDEFSQTAARQTLSLRGHEDLLAALREKDPEKARTAMENHLAAIERTILDNEGI